MQKPEKPTPDFPLYAHRAGYWAKKIKGKTIYFGPWADPDAALHRYRREKDLWEAGMDPRHGSSPTTSIDPDIGVRLGDGCNLFLEAVYRKVEDGRLGMRSYRDYVSTCKRVLAIIDRYTPINSMTIDDWMRVHRELGKDRSPVTLGQDITRLKTCMQWLVDNGKIREPRYGSEFRRPARIEVRRSRANSGRRWFDAREILHLAGAAGPAMKAMILLGVNCGLGNGDCSQLLVEYLDLKRGWLDYDRPKTGTPRRAKLWPETIAAIHAYETKRPKVKLPNLFVTKFGNVWSDPDSAECAVSRAFQQLCRDNGCHIPGRGFYGLRRTFETVAGATKDQVAVDYIMGHIDDSMAAVYRQEIGDDRLEAVAKHVRKWLYGK